MEAICTYLKENVTVVMLEWNALAADEPWIRLPEHHRIGNLPTVVLDIAEAAVCNPPHPSLIRKTVLDAVEHGQQRRNVGLDDDLLFHEYYLLRHVIWHELRSRLGSSEQVASAMIRIDSALHTAQRASLLGYHKQEYRGSKPWDRLLDEIVIESVSLGTQPSS